MGMHVPMREVIEDAIKANKWGLVPGKNEVKITGDGGFLFRRKGMVCFFLQSLMLSEGGQSLESCTPLGILVAKVVVLISMTK